MTLPVGRYSSRARPSSAAARCRRSSKVTTYPPAVRAARRTQQSGSRSWVRTLNSASVPGGVGVQGNGLHSELTERPLRQVSSPRSCWSDQDLGQGEGTGNQAFVDRLEQQVGSPLVMSVARIKVRDEDAGVEDDHAGHSWRNVSR